MARVAPTSKQSRGRRGATGARQGCAEAIYRPRSDNDVGIEEAAHASINGDGECGVAVKEIERRLLERGEELTGVGPYSLHKGEVVGRQGSIAKRTRRLDGAVPG